MRTKSQVSRIQINNISILLVLAWRDGKAFYCCAGALVLGALVSAGLVLGERLMYNGCRRARASLWHGHVPGSAMPSVPDIPLTDKIQ